MTEQPGYRIVQDKSMGEIEGQRVAIFGSYIQDSQGRILPHGQFTAFFANGKVARSGGYNLGRREGVWMDFDQEGSVTGYACYTQFTHAFLPRYEQKDTYLLRPSHTADYKPQAVPSPN